MPAQHAREPEIGVTALPIGRVLRLAIGLLLLVEVAPVYLGAGMPFITLTVLLVIGLIGVYTALQVVLSRRSVRLNPWVGALLVLGILVLVYVLGTPGGLLLGRGEGQLAALTYLCVSLILAAGRGDPGCEVMSIPAVLLGRHSRLACLVFSPIDRLERRLRVDRTS